jgi:hypothetical protein
MSWPYLPHQCPRCRYFAPFGPRAHDDRGYELPGACAHPLIGMELFVARGDLARRLGDCDLFVSDPHSAKRGGQP